MRQHRAHLQGVCKVLMSFMGHMLPCHAAPEQADTPQLCIMLMQCLKWLLPS